MFTILPETVSIQHRRSGRPARGSGDVRDRLRCELDAPAGPFYDREAASLVESAECGGFDLTDVWAVDTAVAVDMLRASKPS